GARVPTVDVVPLPKVLSPKQGSGCGRFGGHDDRPVCSDRVGGKQRLDSHGKECEGCRSGGGTGEYGTRQDPENPCGETCEGRGRTAWHRRRQRGSCQSERGARREAVLRGTDKSGHARPGRGSTGPRAGFAREPTTRAWRGGSADFRV